MTPTDQIILDAVFESVDTDQVYRRVLDSFDISYRELVNTIERYKSFVERKY